MLWCAGFGSALCLIFCVLFTRQPEPAAGVAEPEPFVLSEPVPDELFPTWFHAFTSVFTIGFAIVFAKVGRRLQALFLWRFLPSPCDFTFAPMLNPFLALLVASLTFSSFHSSAFSPSFLLFLQSFLVDVLSPLSCPFSFPFCHPPFFSIPLTTSFRHFESSALSASESASAA